VTFPVNVYLLALVSAGAATALTLPLWRTWCRRSGLVDEPGHRKIHAHPIPLAGGLAVFTGLAVPLLVAVAALQANWFGPATIQPLSHGLGKRGAQLAAVIAGALGMLTVGWVDDRYELRPGVKFAGQCLVAVLVAASGVRITLFVPNLVFSYVVTVLWILTVTNAFNFMDNMNGLSAGVAGITALCFALKAAAAGQYLVASLGLLITGALAGFLPYNFPQASVFLGDSGSHLVGYLVGVLAILPHFYSADSPAALAVLNPLLILAVPLGDLVWVVLLRWRMGRPFYVGDNNHLSHRLVRCGWSQTRAVAFIWLLTAITGAASLW
jgi:UDP-GlcNAc:undecaprenyl-phosphate GlcNAc-1-phosphate transferase